MFDAQSMLQLLPSGLADLLARLRLLRLTLSTLAALAFLAGLWVIIALLEWREGAHPRHYRSRAFLNDVAYSLFYRGGFYNTFIAAALTNALDARLGFLRLNLISGLPVPVAVLVYWIVADFLGYWFHRLQHHSRFLWAFHSVHHAQEDLSFLSSYRLHPIEQLIANLVMIAPFLILGVPTTTWLPIVIIQNGLEAVQHSALDWRYGRLYSVFVSPRFHSLHHTSEPAIFDRNFGKILSVWDFLFGTAIADRERPAHFGVPGLRVPERLSAQLLVPFQILRGSPRVEGRLAGASVEASAVSPSRNTP